MSKLKADYQRLDQQFNSPDGQVVREVVDDICTRHKELLHDDERPLIERSYQAAQRRGVGSNGYVLRFMVEYHVGRHQSRW